MNHYFFSLAEAYQYYLNTAYRFHINTPVWFRFCMVFETSEREKSIEITMDKHGNGIYTTKYYEKQLKRNRILGKDAFCFSTNLNSPITQHISKWKSMKPEDSSRVSRPVFSRNEKRKSAKRWGETPIFESSIVKTSQNIFNRNLSPILLNQIIRSTFGRIEFYYEAFHASSLGFADNY